MTIGIATCAEKPDLIVGDRLFQAELKKLGIDASPVIWTNTSVSKAHYDAVIIRSVWDYHLSSEKFRSWIETMNRNSKLLNSKDTILWNIDKSYLLELENAGIRCVPSMIFNRRQQIVEILEQIRSAGWTELVIKPTVSASAFLTARSSISDVGLQEQIKRILNHSNVMVQPYIPSIQSDGEISLVFFNGKSMEYSHSVLKLPKSGDFRVQSEFGGNLTGFEADPGTVELAKLALGKVPGDWLFARVDIVDWKENPEIGELELIEPDLFLSYHPQAATRFAKATIEKLAL